MTSPLRYLRARVPVALLLAAVVALSYPASASAQVSHQSGRQAQTAARTVATTGGNLLVNPRATAGDTSAQGWDAVTIPGWRVAAGLPTVVRYGTSGFPRVAGSWPSGRGAVFAGGAGGTADLVQDVPLRLPSGGLTPGGTRYQVSAWLGGTSSSWAEVAVRFLSSTGQVLGSRTIGPAGRARQAGFASRSATAVLPAGAATVQVTLKLAPSLTNDNGPDSPLAGYDRAVAADLSLSVSAPVRGPPRSPRRRRACRATSTSSCSTSRTRITPRSLATPSRRRT